MLNNTTTMTSALYNQLWSMLREALEKLLSIDPPSYKPCSYEQMYTAVYKCVCRDQGDRLYDDLMSLLSSILTVWAGEIANEGDQNILQEFDTRLRQYFWALNSIVPIFTYLNRLYVGPKLKTNLNDELFRIYSEIVADPVMPRIIAILVSAEEKPFSINPKMRYELIQNINALNPKYASLNQNLFAKYLSGIAEPMQYHELAKQRESERLLQETLRRNGFGNSSDQSKKRGPPTDISPPDKGK